MTTPPNSEPPNEPPSREAVEAALLYALPRTTPYKSDAEIQARNNASDYLYDIHPRGNSYQSAARILAAEVQRLAVDLGSAQDKLDQIKALCEGHGVGLRDYVLDILKQP